MVSEIERKILKEFKQIGLEARDACGVLCFLDRNEKYKEQMLDFLKHEENRNYESIMHQLTVILGHAK